jgi:hypothetical protein
MAALPFGEVAPPWSYTLAPKNTTTSWNDWVATFTGAEDGDAVQVNWGDGSPPEDTTLDSSFQLSHYLWTLNEGTYTVSASLKGGVPKLQTARVVNPSPFAPTVAPGTDTMEAVFTPTGLPANMEPKASLDWGDGSPVVPIANAADVKRHTYTAAGDYTIIVTHSHSTPVARPFTAVAP